MQLCFSSKQHLKRNLVELLLHIPVNMSGQSQCFLGSKGKCALLKDTDERGHVLMPAMNDLSIGSHSPDY